MKKLLFFILGLSIYTARAQVVSVVTAPNLEQMTSTNLLVQQKGLIQTMQSQINTLNTAKNTYDNLEQIKKIDERITKVSSTLKQARVVYNIFDKGALIYQNAKSVHGLITQHKTLVSTKISTNYINILETTIDEADNVVAVCKDIISENYVMNDYERLKLLNDYYEKINILHSRLSSLKSSYINIVSLSRL